MWPGLLFRLGRSCRWEACRGRTLRDVQNGFRPGVAEKLGFYVYTLSDPRNGDQFYVGKGTGERCFAHLSEARRTTAGRVGDYTKLVRIREIEDAGSDVVIDVLRHGLDEGTALHVESAAIDLLQIKGLTNRVTGHGTERVGRMSVADINALYGAEPLTIDPGHRVALIRVAREFKRGITDEALYEATRRWWVLGEIRRRRGGPGAPEWAMAVYRGVVRAVYRIEGWEAAPEASIIQDPRRRGRWGFWGARDRDMEARYLLGDVTAYLPLAGQNPIRFVNC
jgi:uncharacterized protein